MLPLAWVKGIFPGRVIWAYDQSATKWDGVNGHWWDDASNDQSVINRTITDALTALTGMKASAPAWDALFKYFNANHGKGEVGYKAGEKIVLKVNLNNVSGYGDTDNQIDASPHAVIAMLRQLVNEARVPQSAITVYDAVRIMPDRFYNKVHGEFPNVTYLDSQGQNGRVKVQWQPNVITYAVKTQCGRSIPTAVFQADYLINMAVFKGHNVAGVTLTGKNHYGSINDREHTYINSEKNSMGTYSPFMDLIGNSHLGGNTLLYMIDALYGVRDCNDVPEHWSMMPFNNRWTSSFFLSQDPVAIDSVGLDFLTSQWGATTLFMSNCDNYLHEAALADNPPSGVVYHPDGNGHLSSLGVHEHWNNATDKKYTRNLGTGKGIELVQLTPLTALPAGT